MDEVTKEPQNINKKMGIHLLSNSIWASTGYGGQARLTLPRFKDLGYPVSLTAYYGLQAHTLTMNDMMIFPCGYHPYGMDVAVGNARQAGADILMTNFDIWVCEPPMLKGIPWVAWLPIDSGSISTIIKSKLPHPFALIAESKFGQKILEAEGYKSYYVPCAIDAKVYTPMDRTAAMEEVNKHIQFHLPEDKFIVSLTAMNKGNPSRKAFTQQLQAFKAFHDKHPDTVLYMHTIKSEGGEQQGVNLPEYCRHIGLEVNKDVLFPDPLMMINGYPDVFLNCVYNASDVFLSVTMGEGFGIPIVEAQAAGCPVIVGDWTAMPELCFSGWKVRKDEAQEFWTTLCAVQYSPNWQAIADRLEKAYAMRGNQDYRERARKGALKYDIDTVMEKYWKPTLEDINQKLLGLGTTDYVLNGVPQ
jgi:glycosyltransferase involved in cell wall biosynthesis